MTTPLVRPLAREMLVSGAVYRVQRTAEASLAKAGASLVQAGALLAELRAEMGADPVFGRPEQASDWFIERCSVPQFDEALWEAEESALSRQAWLRSRERCRCVHWCVHSPRH